MSEEFERQREELQAVYTQAAQRGQLAIQEGLVGNPVLLGAKDLRYSLWYGGFIRGPGDEFLERVTKEVSAFDSSD